MVTLFFLMGIGLIALGIYVIAKNTNDDMEKISNAIVISCEDANPELDDHIRNPFNITVEINGAHGLVTETIESDRILRKGAKCLVNYDIQNGVVEFATKNNTRISGMLLAIFGLFWSSFMLARTSFPIVIEESELFGFFILYALGYLFVAIGVYGGIIRPLMRKRWEIIRVFLVQLLM